MADTTRAKIGTPNARKGLLALIVLVVGFVLVVEFLSAATEDTRPPQGRSGSSYSAASDGTRAYADLLNRYNFNVRRVRSLNVGTLTPDETAIVIDPIDFERRDGEKLQNFARSGGHLVIGSGFVELTALSTRPPVWESERQDTWTIATPNAFNDAQKLFTASEGYWVDPGGGSPTVGTANAALLVRESIGSGSIDYIADATLLNNNLIAEADNAAFALALADNGTRTVVFVELDGAAAPAEGLAALPERWKLAMLVFVLAAALLAWSTAQRFGPPESAERVLPPARGEYINAMGAALARTKEVEANRAALSEKALRTLRRNTVNASQIDEIASLYRCDPDDLRVLFGLAPMTDNFAAPRAFAAIHATSNMMQTTGKGRS